jgi:hypothetical protein
MYKQLDFLPRSFGDVERKIDDIKESTEKVRKGLYVRHNELAKMILEIKLEFEEWKSTLCKEKQ